MTDAGGSTIFDSADKIVEAFADFDFDGLLASTDQDYYLISEAVRKEQDEANARGDLHLATGLQLLWVVCSFYCRPENEGDPFGPMIVLVDRRSPIPDDLTQVQISVLAQMTNLINDPYVRGRIADVVWLQGKPSNYKYALTAIESYTEEAIDATSWIGKREDNWRRALSLAKMLGAPASALLTNIESSLLASLKAAQISDRYFGARIASALRHYGLARSEGLAIAGRLADLASHFHSIGDFDASADHFVAAAKWYALVDDELQQMVMIALQGRAMVRAAEARIGVDGSGYLVAAVDAEKALQVFRQIPLKYRAELGVDEVLNNLPAQLRDYGERSLGEMKTISTPPINISAYIQAAEDSVRGKPAHEALRVFAGIQTCAVSELRTRAEETLKKYPLQALFQRATFSQDGRTISRSRGSESHDPSQDEAQVWSQMLQFYTFHAGATVHTAIHPALQVMRSEHRMRERDFIAISRRSPFVPIGREVLFGKALGFGFNGDFATSIHLLTPQIENAVRYHLRAAGVTTTGIDQDGVESEKSLNALLDLPEIESLFGDNLAFELRVLFCEQIGGNLRNEVAHGLLDDDASTSNYSVYAWWFTLKLAYMSFWNALVAQSTPEAQAEEGNQDPEGDG